MKQAIILRTDLSMSRGKLVAQGCHASVGAFIQSKKKDVKKWLKEGAKKVSLKATSLEDLQTLKSKAESQGIACYLVVDAGHTELEPGTTTALGVGPASDELIDSVTGSLKLL